MSGLLAGLGPEPLRKPLASFLFEPETWVHPSWLSARLKLEGAAASDSSVAGAPAGHWPARWVRQQIDREAPLAGFDMAGFTGQWAARLALLPSTDALRLGMAVSLLPLAGQLQRSMDGHLRRALRQHFDDAAIAALDAGAAGVVSARSALAPGAWRQPDRVACAGLQAAVRQACPWPEAVLRRFEWRMEPQVWAVPASVTGLTMESLEVACRALFPDHPWLWC